MKMINEQREYGRSFLKVWPSFALLRILVRVHRFLRLVPQFERVPVK